MFLAKVHFVKNLMLVLCITIIGEFHNVDAVSVNARIANGQKAEENDFPYQVALKSSNIYFFKFYSKISRCAGSIISLTWILTAAHCVNE